MAMYVNKVYLLFKRPDHDQIEFDVDELTELKEKSDSSSDSKNWLKSDSKSDSKVAQKVTQKVPFSRIFILNS